MARKSRDASQGAEYASYTIACVLRSEKSRSQQPIFVLSSPSELELDFNILGEKDGKIESLGIVALST